MIRRTTIAFSLLAAPLAADPICPATNSVDLNNAAQALVQNIRTGDYSAIVDNMPERVLVRLTQKAGIPREVFETATARQLETTMGQYGSTLKDFMISSFPNEVFCADGALPYAFLPTSIEIEISDESQIIETQTFAVYDNRTWSLLRVDGPQHIEFLTGVYPELAGLNWPGN